jgi:hypothetical protein
MEKRYSRRVEKKRLAGNKKEVKSWLEDEGGTKEIRKKEEALGKKSGREMTRRERREDGIMCE